MQTTWLTVLIVITVVGALLVARMVSLARHSEASDVRRSLAASETSRRPVLDELLTKPAFVGALITTVITAAATVIVAVVGNNAPAAPVDCVAYVQELAALDKQFKQDPGGLVKALGTLSLTREKKQCGDPGRFVSDLPTPSPRPKPTKSAKAG
jgi:hypothetical protein